MCGGLCIGVVDAWCYYILFGVCMYVCGGFVCMWWVMLVCACPPRQHTPSRNHPSHPPTTHPPIHPPKPTTPRWHHIFLSLLPHNLLDYLSSPIPYLIGLPAQFLPRLSTLPLEEVTIIDLDLQRCTPAPGCSGDDGLLLPYRRRLIESLEVGVLCVCVCVFV